MVLSGLNSFVPTFLFSILALLLPSSSASLFYFILAVPMRDCFGKHSCISSPFSIAILNGASASCGQLQLGVPHWATSEITASS